MEESHQLLNVQTRKIFTYLEGVLTRFPYYDQARSIGIKVVKLAI